MYNCYTFSILTICRGRAKIFCQGGQIWMYVNCLQNLGGKKVICIFNIYHIFFEKLYWTHNVNLGNCPPSVKGSSATDHVQGTSALIKSSRFCHCIIEYHAHIENIKRLWDLLVYSFVINVYEFLLFWYTLAVNFWVWEIKMDGNIVKN